MRILLWLTALAVLAIWSLLGWVGYLLVPPLVTSFEPTLMWLGFDAAAAGSVRAAAAALASIAEWSIIAVWALGAVVILAAPIAIRRTAWLAGRAGDGLAGAALAWLDRRRRRRGFAVIPGRARRIAPYDPQGGRGW